MRPFILIFIFFVFFTNGALAKVAPKPIHIKPKVTVPTLQPTKPNKIAFTKLYSTLPNVALLKHHKKRDIIFKLTKTVLV